jgi:hypothetical protein
MVQSRMSFSPMETEVLVLQAMVESINAVVNHEVLAFGQPYDGETQVGFQSISSRALFNVLLADMLEQCDPKLLGASGSLIDHLQRVAHNPQFETSDSEDFRLAVDAFVEWLNAEIVVPVWFPSIDKQVDLKLRRRDFISICGNVSKHGLSRLTRKAQQLASILEANGVNVDQLKALRALDDFYERFHTDILSYHCSSLAQMMNNIRWGIQGYLRDEFMRSYVPPESEAWPRYSYRIPKSIQSDFAESRYWDLMNTVRAKPWIERFVGPANLRKDY